MISAALILSGIHRRGNITFQFVIPKWVITGLQSFAPQNIYKRKSNFSFKNLFYIACILSNLEDQHLLKLLPAINEIPIFLVFAFQTILVLIYLSPYTLGFPHLHTAPTYPPRNMDFSQVRSNPRAGVPLIWNVDATKIPDILWLGLKCVLSIILWVSDTLYWQIGYQTWSIKFDDCFMSSHVFKKYFEKSFLKDSIFTKIYLYAWWMKQKGSGKDSTF